MTAIMLKRNGKQSFRLCVALIIVAKILGDLCSSTRMTAFIISRGTHGWLVKVRYANRKRKTLKVSCWVEVA